jgi:aspartyl-tRNA(Asn)/glutamyl-tRNA(Gln) amidotransferase subunit A
MNDSAVAFATISEIAHRIEHGEVTPLDLTEAMLARVKRHDQLLNSFITVMEDAAIREAEAATAEIAAGRYKGPLHGVPVAVKDLFATVGVRTTFGTRLYSDWVPDFDATVVEKLRAAGAVNIGKLNMHELAAGTDSINPHFGAIRNPWREDCHTGGSSGGSAAAVAAGLVFAAIGTDTGASVRQPAHCCGIVGLKPTFGRVSKFGGLPLSWSMDHAGPMTRTVRDNAIVLQAIAGYDRRDPGCADMAVPDYLESLDRGIAGLRIGIARDYFFENCEADVAARVEAAFDSLRDLGADVFDFTELPDMNAVFTSGNVIIGVEAHACYEAEVRRDPENFSDAVRSFIEFGGYYTAAQFVQAQRLRRLLTAEVIKAMAGLDAIVMPTSPIATAPIETTKPSDIRFHIQNTLPFDAVSLPALSVPCGFTADGRPVGLQIVGKPFDEAGVLRIAYSYEQASDWVKMRPEGY